jgi:hypothetical protein
MWVSSNPRVRMDETRAGADLFPVR